MPVDRGLLRRMSLSDAVGQELSWRNRLLPRRWDYAALAAESSAVEEWLRPQLRRGPSGRAASIVFADKGWRGSRPLHIMTLEDMVLYRALVGLIKEALPERLASRESFENFRKAALDVADVKYVSKTDVTAYYEFVDHELLCSELIAQTGEELAVETLADLLASVLGRRVGLPQVHPSSDVLGDTYIDPVRRRLLRRGHAVFTYSDDFRIASRSLGDARASLEACAMEVHALGLVLNERKTYTYAARNYRKSLTSFADAERRLFEEGKSRDSSASLGFLDSDYGDADGDEAVPATLGASQLDHGVDEDEAVTTDEYDVIDGDLDPQRVRAAERAWELWEQEDESEETQASQDAAITQSLLGRALPMLGRAGDNRPVETLSELLRYEPALSPQIVAYLENYGETGKGARTEIRNALDKVVESNILSTWQGMWLAHAAGFVSRSTHRHPYEDWLARCVSDGHDGLAATAAASLGRIGGGDADLVAGAVARVGPEWRRLAFWGLIGLDRSLAESTADDALERMLLAEAEDE